MHGVHKNQIDIIKRLKKIEGQIKGVQKMIDNDVYCIDIITQTSAIKSAISSVEDIMLSSHLEHCLLGQMKEGKSKKIQEEILQVYKLKRK
jgi:DNA-binding FrmR family transcriptional regulator